MLFQRRQAEKEKSDESENIRRYQLWFPQGKDLLERAYPNPDQQRTIKEIKQQFDKAQAIIIPTGTWGLGDCVMELRYAHHLAKKTGKQVIIQVAPALLPVLEKLGPKLQKVSYTSEVNGALLQDDRTFVLSLRQSGRLRNNIGWATVQPNENYTDTIDGLTSENRVMEVNPFSATSNHWQTVIHNLQPPSDHAQLAEAMYSLQLKLMGVDIKVDDIRSNSILSLNKEMVSLVPQDIDYFFLPDAKELEARQSNPKRSRKSLTKGQWEDIFAKLPKNTSVAIVRGVSHPQYCDQIIQTAKQFGLQPKIIEGSLDQLVLQMLRAKTIFGMDSGTTHLAQEVVRSAAKAGRRINLRTAISGTTEFLSSYTIAEQNSFVRQTPDHSMPQDLATLGPDEVLDLVSYVTEK